MRNNFDLFLLFRVAAIIFCVLTSCWCVCLLLTFAETEELPAGPPVKILAPEKNKRPQNPLSGQEAQIIPWTNKLENCVVTYYDVCLECCGKLDGITYNGSAAVPYETCAVDPSVIPLGSAVSVDYGDGILHHYRAEDIGGGVKGNHIDVCVADHEEAIALGTRTAMVYWMEMEVLE